MLDFEQIREQYPANLRRFERAILREYLQYKVLQAIFDSHHASKLAFLGGTALRIVHGKGTGTIRRIVHAALDRHPAVASYRHEGGSGGSWGATVVDLKPL